MRREFGKKTGSRDIGKKRHGRRRENLPKSPERKTEVSTCLGSLFFTPPLNVSPPLTVHSPLDLPLVLGTQGVKVPGGMGSGGNDRAGLYEEKGLQSQFAGNRVVGWYVVGLIRTVVAQQQLVRRGDCGEGRGIDRSCADDAKHSSSFSCYAAQMYWRHTVIQYVLGLGMKRVW